MVLKSVLLVPYSRRSLGFARQSPLLLAVPLLVAGCSLSMPVVAPATTGSVVAPVAVREPVPESLARSDAIRVGQAASVALWQSNNRAVADWINPATGSSGTLERLGRRAKGQCRSFATIVTSIGGVHRYAGEVCRDANGASVVKIAAQRVAESS